MIFLEEKGKKGPRRVKWTGIKCILSGEKFSIEHIQVRMDRANFFESSSRLVGHVNCGYM